MRTYKMLVACALAGALSLAGLSACDSGPKSASELVSRYEAAENHDNFASTTRMSLAGDGETIFSVLNVSESTSDASHAVVDVSALGYTSRSERYIERSDDGAVVYQSSEDEGITTWMRYQTGNLPMANVTDKALLEKAGFEKTDSGYTLSVPGETFNESLKASLTSTDGNDLSGYDGIMGALADSMDIEKSDAVYTFGDDFLLRSITWSLEARPKETGDQGTTLTLTYSTTFDGYGSVDAKTVAVPDEVRNEAIDLSQAQDMIAKVKQQFDSAVSGALNGLSGAIGDLANNLSELANSLKDPKAATAAASAIEGTIAGEAA